MDIYLSYNNREEIIILPVLPAKFEVNKPQNNDTFESISLGELKLIGLRGLKSISFESFFPIRDYPFLRDNLYSGHEYVYKLDTWREKRVPIRILITDTPINMAVTIDDFKYSIGTDGDIYYSITLGEFRFVELEQSEV